MALPSLLVIVLLFISSPSFLHADGHPTVTTSDTVIGKHWPTSFIVTTEANFFASLTTVSDLEGTSRVESQSEGRAIPVDTATDTVLEPTTIDPPHQTISEAIFPSIQTSPPFNPVSVSQHTPLDSTDVETTGPTVVDLSTTLLPRTTLQTTVLETTKMGPDAPATVQSTAGHTPTTLSPALTTSSQYITSPPPSTTIMDLPVSTLSTTNPTSATSIVPPLLLQKTSIPRNPTSTTPHLETTSIDRGAIDDTETTETPYSPDLSLVEGPSSDERAGLGLWPWVICGALLAALASMLCVTLVVKRRRQKAGRTLMNGLGQRSKRKSKGKADDAWAGPVWMGEAKDGQECDAEDGNDETEGIKNEQEVAPLSTFTPCDDVTAVGADGTKEAKRWGEESPLLYIDEDVDDNEEDAKVAEEEGALRGQQPMTSQKCNNGVTGPREVMNGNDMNGTGGATNGAVAFCQTTAV